MKVGLFYVRLSPPRDARWYTHLAPMEYAALGALTVAAIHRVMPGVPVYHLTDEDTPPLAGVDHVVRRPILQRELMLQRVMHFAALPEGDWLWMDTDVILQRDVRPVFQHPRFEVAVTDRFLAMGLPPDAMILNTEMSQCYPYNTAVVFTRSRAFWQDVVRYYHERVNPIRYEWLGDQEAINGVVKSGNYRVLVLPGYLYNYVPTGATDDLSGKFGIHLKGSSKRSYCTQDSTLGHFSVLGAASGLSAGGGGGGEDGGHVSPDASTVPHVDLDRRGSL